MELQKTQVFQRKRRWNPRDSKATTLPNIQHKSHKSHKSQARQYKFQLANIPSMPPSQPINYDQYIRQARESRAINAHFAASRAQTNQRTSSQNPLNRLPTTLSTIHPIRNQTTQSRLITTPISSLSIFQVLNVRDNSPLKFKASIDKMDDGEIKYLVEEEPEKLEEMRKKECMVDVYVGEMGEKVMGYRKEIKRLEEERQKLKRQKQAITSKCDPKLLKRVQQSRQRLKNKQQQIAESTLDQQSYPLIVWTLKDQYFELHKDHQQALDKLPKNVRILLGTKEFEAIEIRLDQVEKLLEVKREALVSLETDMVRMEKEKLLINKRRTQVVLGMVKDCLIQ